MSERRTEIIRLSSIVANGKNCPDLNMLDVSWGPKELKDPEIQEAAARCGECAVRDTCLQLGVLEGNSTWLEGVYGGVLRRSGKAAIDLLTGQEVPAGKLFTAGIDSLTDRKSA